MAFVTFRVHYWTQWGENLYLDHRVAAETGAGTKRVSVAMQHDGDGFWSVQLESPGPGSRLEYRYEFRDAAGSVRREPVDRRLDIVDDDQVVWDHFFAPELPDGAFLRQAFAGVIFQPNREAGTGPKPGTKPLLRLTLRAPRGMVGHKVCLSGDHPLLGQWEPARALVMSGRNYPLWEVDLPADAFSASTEFKFGLWDEREQRLVQWENGPNRLFHGAPPGAAALVVNYEHYRHPQEWRGAGAAIPVFSLRTERSYGIGEFADLALLAQWAARCQLHLVQLLPVNDTSSHFTWEDSYPYKAISTAALHPVYLNIEQMFREYGLPLPEGYEERRAALNRLSQIDYETVIKDKREYLRGLYNRVGEKVRASREFKDYLREQASWLQPYAAFCRLRDLHGTADFTQWGEDATYRPEAVQGWFRPDAPEYGEVAFHCWVQFHLDRQLAAAVSAGHAFGVAFKGDLPIGVDRCSVEVWTEPELFRLDRQTGAPPDAFAVLGQNWGFPTYNWPRMEVDKYSWWQQRFQRMSAAFDALRIDHILGFFRIWEIPMRYREGIMGHYDPTLPLSREEIARAGVALDPGQFVVGTVSGRLLAEFFGGVAEQVRDALLVQDAEDYCRVRSEFEPAEARQTWYATALTEEQAAEVEGGVRQLGFEVLFVEDTDQPDRFHPRINLADTLLFQSLPGAQQAALRRLHDDYYYRRHTQFWADEAMKKLPVLMDASPMLICGEDLGMVPDSVPMVLRRLGLLSLEVQRWPKVLGQRFGNPADYPYLSVCTASTHDMSTIRGWWEEEAEPRQHFWTEVMRREGAAPAECSAADCRFVVEQNLAGTSMWCILLLQDWLGIDARLRHPVAAEERINVPAVSRHYWRYRMHLTLEVLREADDFNRTVAGLVEASGRNQGG